jgi:hypothetical protein
MSLSTGGDWPLETQSPLLFLQKGFRELVKCRQILRGSFPFSFYMMPTETSKSSGWRRFFFLTQFHNFIFYSYQNYESAQRKMYAESRQEVFVQIQSDLERLTETLSGLEDCPYFCLLP